MKKNVIFLYAVLSGVFIRSALWVNFKSIMPMEDDTSSVVFCALSSVKQLHRNIASILIFYDINVRKIYQAWTQYFYMATWIWTLCYAIDMKLLLGDRSGHPTCYHAFAWICPAILTTFGLTILYIPDAKSVSFNFTMHNDFANCQLFKVNEETFFFQLP